MNKPKINLWKVPSRAIVLHFSRGWQLAHQQSPLVLYNLSLVLSQPWTSPHCFWGTYIVALSLINPQLVARNTLLSNVLSLWHSEATLNTGSWSGKVWTNIWAISIQAQAGGGGIAPGICAYIQVNMPSSHKHQPHGVRCTHSGNNKSRFRLFLCPAVNWDLSPEMKKKIDLPHLKGRNRNWNKEKMTP